MNHKGLGGGGGYPDPSGSPTKKTLKDGRGWKDGRMEVVMGCNKCYISYGSISVRNKIGI